MGELVPSDHEQQNPSKISSGVSSSPGLYLRHVQPVADILSVVGNFLSSYIHDAPEACHAIMATR